jgi:hypothetical protein
VTDCDIEKVLVELEPHRNQCLIPSPTSQKASLYAGKAHVTRTLVGSSQLESSNNPRTSQSRIYQYATPTNHRYLSHYIYATKFGPDPIMLRKTLQRPQSCIRPNNVAPFEPQLLSQGGDTCRSIHTPPVHTSDFKRITEDSGQWPS